VDKLDKVVKLVKLVKLAKVARVVTDSSHNMEVKEVRVDMVNKEDSMDNQVVVMDNSNSLVLNTHNNRIRTEVINNSKGMETHISSSSMVVAKVNMDKAKVNMDNNRWEDMGNQVRTWVAMEEVKVEEVKVDKVKITVTQMQAHIMGVLHHQCLMDQPSNKTLHLI